MSAPSLCGDSVRRRSGGGRSASSGLRARLIGEMRGSGRFATLSARVWRTRRGRPCEGFLFLVVFYFLFHIFGLLLF